MTQKIYLNCLILYGILSQGIIVTFSKDNIIESSDLLVRNKRQVIANRSHAIMKLSIHQIPYVVQILKNNEYTCVGSIIMTHVILTVAHCLENPGPYQVLSGSEYVQQGNIHVVERVLKHPEYHPNRYENDLALLFINPGINIESANSRLIKMYNGFIPPGTVGLVSGWGCIGVERGREIYPRELRSIVTCVISEENCRRMQSQYNQFIPVNDRNICVLDHAEGGKCSTGDSGAPFVFSNQLVGIMAWSRDDHRGPDVFVNLSHPLYRRWILQNIPAHHFYPDSPHFMRHK